MNSYSDYNVRCVIDAKGRALTVGEVPKENETEVIELHCFCRSPGAFRTKQFCVYGAPDDPEILSVIETLAAGNGGETFNVSDFSRLAVDTAALNAALDNKQQ